jgi:hypothetical protein
MTIHLEIPDDIEQDIRSMDNAVLTRKLMETTAVEAYRQRRIGTADVSRMLGFDTRWETIEFLSTYKAYPNYNEEDLEEDRATLEKILGKPPK